MTEHTIQGPSEDNFGWWVKVGETVYRFATYEEAVGFKNIMMNLMDWAQIQDTESRMGAIQTFLRRYGIEPLVPDENGSQERDVIRPKAR